MLTDGEQVGEDLAGVVVVGEGINDGHAGVLSHLFETRLGIGAPDDGGDHAGNDLGGI